MQQKDKLGSEAQFRKPRRARIVSRRASEEEEEERACGTSLPTHLPSVAIPHLICWSISLPTFHVRLNLAPISCLCVAKNLGCMSHGLTYMGFEISRNFGNLIWDHMNRPNISTGNILICPLNLSRFNIYGLLQVKNI
jgi:hypothetical protein